MTLAGDARPQAVFGARAAVVRERIESGPYIVLTALDESGIVPAAGQFYMLRTAEGWGGGEDGRPYLPRALSFARSRVVDGGVELDFFFEAVGPGTERLGQCLEGEELVLTGPFGNGFDVESSRESVLVAGGIGLAPIVALADELSAAGSSFKTVIGMRSAAHAEAIAHYGIEHELATDDGSAGRKGFVTELLAEALDAAPDSTVYACGPSPMLEAARVLAAGRNVAAQLAMESGMACGFGACYGCVVPTRDGYLRLCVDGPVLDAARLDSALAVGGGH